MTLSRESIIHGLSSIWRKVWRRKVMNKDMMETKLDRCMSTFDLILLGIGHMAGAGIYVLTGTVMANIAGPSTILSYLFGGILILLIAICYTQISVNIPRAGTCYSCIYIIAGELVGFLSGWTLVGEYIIMVSSVGRALSTYLDSLSGGWIRNATLDIVGHGNSSFVNNIDLLSPAAILLIFIIIAIGMKSTAWMNNILAVLNISLMLVIIGAGIFNGNISNITAGPGGFFPYGITGTFRGTGVAVAAYIGFDAIATASEETKNPERSLPVAFAVAIGIVTVLYCMASFALSLLVCYDEVDIGAPFPSAFTGYGLLWVKYLVSIGATIGLTCSLLGQSYCLSRYLYALASDGLLFTQFTYVNSWTKAPLVAILASAVIGAVLAMILPIEELVEMVSGGALIAFAMMLVCLLKLHYLPASECPFEILKPETSTLNIGETKENTPILQKGSNQERIGTLRYPVPLLRKFKSGQVISVVLTVICLSLVVLSCCIIVGSVPLAQGQLWIISLVIFVGAMFSISLFILLLYEHNTSFAKFKVPVFPLIPLLPLGIVLCLLMSLGPLTWIRFIVWAAVGIILYFSYGIRHSSVDSGKDYIELKTVESSLTTSTITATEEN